MREQAGLPLREAAAAGQRSSDARHGREPPGKYLALIKSRCVLAYSHSITFQELVPSTPLTSNAPASSRKTCDRPLRALPSGMRENRSDTNTQSQCDACPRKK